MVRMTAERYREFNAEEVRESAQRMQCGQGDGGFFPDSTELLLWCHPSAGKAMSIQRESSITFTSNTRQSIRLLSQTWGVPNEGGGPTGWTCS